MSDSKFLNVDPDGRTRQKVAVNVSSGAPDADKIPRLGADGRFDESMMPAGYGDDANTREASESLAGPSVVAYFDEAGANKVRNADATAEGKEADGFVLDSATSGSSAKVFNEGTVTGLSGLTPGARYYLSTTPGQITATAPTGSGNVVQYLGKAISATELVWEPDDGIILA